MSPSTALIHRANMAMAPRQALAHALVTPTAATMAASPPSTPAVIDTPSFVALPLSLTINPALYRPPSSSSLPSPPSASRARPPPPPPPPPPTAAADDNPLVSSRGRTIKLRKGSIHLKRQTSSSSSSSSSSPPSTLPSSPSAGRVAAAPAAPSSAAASLLVDPLDRFFVHTWCLWQLRAEYLLGETRRKLKKQAAGRSAPSTPQLRPHPPPPPQAAFTFPHASDGEMKAPMTPRSDGRGRWQRRLADELKDAGNGRPSPARAPVNGGERKVEGEERNFFAPPPPPLFVLPPSTPAAHRVPVPAALALPGGVGSPGASLSSITALIPAHHTSLTMPMIPLLSSTLSSLTVPPSAAALPFFTALAACLLLPLPLPRDALTPSHCSAPHKFSYEGVEQCVVDGVWHMPRERVTIAYEEVDHADVEAEAESKERSERREHRRAPSSHKRKGGAHPKGRVVKPPSDAEVRAMAALALRSREARMAERARKESQRDAARPDPRHAKKSRTDARTAGDDEKDAMTQPR